MHGPERQKDSKKCICEIVAISAKLPNRCMTCGRDVR